MKKFQEELLEKLEVEFLEKLLEEEFLDAAGENPGGISVRISV